MQIIVDKYPVSVFNLKSKSFNFEATKRMAFNGNLLKELRLRKKDDKGKPLSVVGLGFAADIEFTTLYRIESREIKNPTFETVEKLSDFFEVPMDIFKLKDRF